MSAWPDYVDARRRLVHEWREQGWSVDDIAGKLEVFPWQVDQLLQEPLDPPFPGSSRHQVIEWRKRINALEAEIYAAGAVPSEPPKESEFRALTAHADPELCGCQYWTDHPKPGRHHPKCEHAEAEPASKP